MQVPINYKKLTKYSFFMTRITQVFSINSVQIRSWS